MAVKLSRTAYDHAKGLVKEGRVVLDAMDDWSEHQPSAEDENEFIEEHGYAEYGKWHLGIDDEHRPETKGHYKYPYGDFQDVHRCGVLSAESRAGRSHHEDIKSAAAHLHGMLEASGQPAG
ncbi:MAG: hypothetical protein QOK00_3658 [Thermoleophilaceae bacterium]|jgi:hypothetical protein|nr:hypothetical protein [Thermoleophilaceae bacterium]MEA2403255.1 hypothetical protein [Thermoleophilaceae bacterium]MEA2456049.1 hypothetical protein [Thermoleophilaceae bacterium]